MLDRLLPPRIDNTYRGHRAGLWLFVPVAVMKIGIALATIFNGREAAQSADGIPLGTYGAGGVQAVLALFAIWGLAQLAVGGFSVLALVRYRAMIPLMFTVLLGEHLARKLLLFAKPIATTGTPPGMYINLALVAAMLAGLVLSLVRKR